MGLDLHTAALLALLAPSLALAQTSPDAGGSPSAQAASPQTPDGGATPAPERGATPAQDTGLTVAPDSSAPLPAPAEPPEAPASAAKEPAPLETVVRAARPYTAASSSTVRDRDFLLRPHPRPVDILQVVPGLYTNQHAGGGKANQYFLRGFDADHGTDVALSVDGVPVNLVSHGHGQGYADLNWIIPEVVQRVDVAKGPYFASLGDFATAGAVNLVARDAQEQSQLTLGGGSFRTYRALGLFSPELGEWKPLLAAQVYGTNGPFDSPERLKRYSLFGKLTRQLPGGAQLSLAVTSYGSGWNASGQIPLREVEAGRLSRFGTLDPDEGGNSQRHSVYAQYRARTDGGGEVQALAYLVQYRLNLYSNFTFFSRDPVNGDMIEQYDARTLAGFHASYRFAHELGSVRLETTVGAQLRSDTVDNGLYDAKARERLSPGVLAHVREGSLGAYAQEDVTFTRWLRLVAGLRADYFGFSVDDRLEDLGGLGTKSSGVRQASQLSPKASLVVSALPETELYLNYGDGFHSNDARGVVREPDAVTPLTRARGYEVGARTRLFDRLDLAGSLFLLDLDSELVWVGDEGGTEARGPTRRRGLEGEARLRLLSWLYADADVTVSRATYVQNAGNANAVALAPTFILQGGLSARHPSGVYGRLGALHLADRPATEDRFLTAEGFTRVDATLGYRARRFELSLAVQNLLDTPWREAQFANVSRLPSETGPESCPAGTRPAGEPGAFEGCEDLHFTPGAPLNAQLAVSLFF
ncbi:TonB-dependent receptor [Aggregicoccus sp. 17bor-14]|uniref:TonB-dependent receptor n=1 Tax=Myxococcaceae TaxID=31 RepID=UPI00129C6CB3|nr:MULTISPECIES: TonB-dependent receptor [Myxococcaceae]MBF5045293.1 TonB-dependent receptor [Simulacricoccus sp. 17bor-14]MRI91034.1 TonB-dependent receptor [Aggregicoccus sp. 17bor-14]